MEKFEQFVDMTDINDSMEIDSGICIYQYTKNDKKITIQTIGEVRVDYKDNLYECASEMPAELLEKFHDGSAYQDENVAISNNNWFEAFVDGLDGKFYDSDVVDIENYTPAKLLELCREIYHIYKEFYKWEE